jgi:collagen type VI alpha
MRSALLSILDDVAIAESNCPTGARVAVVSYSANTKYLIRFQDYQRKPELLEAIQNIALERTSNQRHLGEAMRFVGRHVFKRTRKALTMRKVAVFFTNGPSVDSAAIVTAAMEFKALNIAPAVIAMRNTPDVQRAFEVQLLTDAFWLWDSEQGSGKAGELKCSPCVFLFCCGAG